MNFKIPSIVASISFVIIVAILVFRSDVAENVRYVDQRSFNIIGCDLGDGGSHDKLRLKSRDIDKTTELMFSVKTKEVCSAAFQNISNFKIGFYKHTLISLAIDNRVLISEAEGVSAYKRKGTVFIWIILLFNLFSGGITYISRSLKKSA